MVLLPSGTRAGEKHIKYSELQVVPLSSAPLWVDRMEFGVRGDIPVATVRFYSVCPPNLVEASRLQTSVAHLKQMVDVLCQSLDYYPSKAEKA